MSKPHAATPPDDPANPELEQELRNIIVETMPLYKIEDDKAWIIEEAPIGVTEAKDQLVALISQREAQAYERGAADYITWGYGKRCKTKDLHDFPDLKEGERCPSCEEWEHYDEWLLEKGKPE